ncbi:cytochrome-c peroxidase [Reichenbachiella versicolor]|uniref:cytochrome-c peroxidase n=1 Tax=Reichenbachiella versicolor TaxID=1821036 RepID=UPI001C87FA04|nr:cytochrome c peroxidase [Reichenbachiella versicolor]
MLTHVDWGVVQEYYLENISQAISLMDSLTYSDTGNQSNKEIFKQIRIAFKKAEPYSAYLKPEVGHRVNGPALPVFRENSGRVLAPVGLQRLEEMIYLNDATKDDFTETVRITKGMMLVLKSEVEYYQISPKRFFISTKQQLFRLVSLAMAGFDTPVSGLSISETAVSLESLWYLYSNSIRPIILSKNEDLDNRFKQDIDDATNYIDSNPDFSDFDQYTFIRNYLNPVTREWANIITESGLWSGENSVALNLESPTFFEKDSWNTPYFLTYTDRIDSSRVLLGKKLFFDPKVSGQGNMSCATCHLPDRAYASNKQFDLDNAGKELDRNTPTLINSVYQKAFKWDGKAQNIEDQISLVFLNDREFDTDVHRFSENLLSDTSYIEQFQDAFGKVPHSNREVIEVIGEYIATLNSFDSKFDKNIRGELETFTSSEKRGFNLYMGKALCGTCHFVPLTNGSVPPFFNETEKEVIGVPKTSDNKQLDDDLGFYTVYGKEIHRGMFKTPSIRNVTKSAPYMHNGVYETLEEVIDFYDLGGGAGLGFDIPYQTLPFDSLSLSKREKKDLIAFIETLTE